MTSAFGGTGLALTATDPPVNNGGWSATLTPQVSSWKHTTQALGGYWNASFQLNAPLDELEGWLQDGLGRDITLYDDAGVVLWNGFVDRMQLNAGPLNATHGPLTNIANNVNLWYSTVDTSTTPPTVGCRRATGVTADATSQARYGIFTKILSCGGARFSEAIDLRDIYLLEHAWPEADQASGSDSPPGLTVDCLGYAALLRCYPYNSVLTGIQTITTKMPLVLAADPSARFSTDYTQLAPNGIFTKAYENDNDTAWDVLKGLVAQGTYTFGVYANRRAVYQPDPTIVMYYQHLHEPGRLVRDARQAEVHPWNVQAGQWLLFPDFLVGRVPENVTLRQDPRAAFLESVTYTAPSGLTWQGGRIREIDQKLAQLGLSGIGG